MLFLKDYANYIQDEIVTNLTDLDRNMMLSIDILNVPTDEAVREVENRLLGVRDEYHELAAPAKSETTTSPPSSLRYGITAQGEQGVFGRPDHPRPCG